MIFGDDHLEVALILDERAWIANALGQPAAALKFYKQAIAMREKQLKDPDSIELAASLNNLAETLVDSGEWQEAEAVVCPGGSWSLMRSTVAQ